MSDVLRTDCAWCKIPLHCDTADPTGDYCCNECRDSMMRALLKRIEKLERTTGGGRE